MAKSTVEVELLALVGDATKTVKRFADDTQKQLSGISFAGNVTAISTGFLAISKIASSAFSTVNAVFGTAVKEAIEAERGINSLANSMRLAGDFSDQASAEMLKFADALAEATLNSDDQVIASLALAKSFNLTNREAREVSKSAAELAAITGDTLAASTEKLAKSYNGFIDKSLKQLIPELASLTKEQLANGEAVRIVSERYSGSAINAVNTFEGSIIQLTKSTSNLLETFGGLITQSSTIKNFFSGLTGEINAVNEGLSSGNFTKLFFDLRVGEGFKDASERLKEVKASAEDAERAIKNSMRSNTLSTEVETQIKNQRKLNLDREKALEEFNSIRSSIELAGLSEIEKINIDAANKIKVIKAAVDTGAVASSAKLQKQILGIEADRVKKVLEIQKKASEEAAAFDKKTKEQATNDLKEIISDPIKAVINGSIVNIKDFAAAGAGFVSNILKGSQGALNLVKQAAGAAASALLGEAFGPIAGDIVGILAQGPEEVRKQVQEFAKAIPQIIQNLIDSLPILIEELAKELPPALAKTMPFIAERFAIALVRNIPQIIKGFAEGLFQAAKDFGQAIIDFVKDAGGLVSGISGKGSGGALEGIPILGGIGDLFGFAEGGRVPTSPQFEGDKFPAKLNSGEQVLSKDLSSQLERFLSGGGNGGQPLVVNVMVGQQQLARAILDLNRGGFRTA